MNRTCLVLILIGAIGCDTSDKQNAKPSTQVAESSTQLDALAAEVAKLRSEVKTNAAAEELIATLTQKKHDALFELVDSTKAMEKKLKKRGKLPAHSNLVHHALIVPGHDPLATLDLQTEQIMALSRFLGKNL